MKTRNWFNESLLIESVNHFLFYATKLPFAGFVHLCIQSMLLPDTRLLSCFTSQRLLKTLVVFTILCSVTSTQSNNHVNKVQRLGTVNISAKFHGRWAGSCCYFTYVRDHWESFTLAKTEKKGKKKRKFGWDIRLGDIWVLENIVNHTEKTFLSMHHWSHIAITKNSSAAVVTFGAWYATLFVSSIQQDYITEWGAEQDLFSLELFLKGTAIFLY